MKVVEVEDHNFLPLPDGKFDLIINRHEYYTPAEIKRLLRDGGMFITQQVGAENNLKINELLNAPKPKTYDPYWTVNQLAVELQEVGLQILKQVSDTYKTRIYDIGALLYYLKAIPWQIPDFDPDAFYQPLCQTYSNLRKVIHANFLLHRGRHFNVRRSMIETHPMVLHLLHRRLSCRTNCPPQRDVSLLYFVNVK